MPETTISEAAQLLGISQATVKRRLRQGVITGRQEARPQGFFWLVEIDEDQINHKVTTRSSDGDSDGHSTDTAELTTLVTMLQAQVQAQGEELESRRQDVQQLLTTHHEEIRELHTLLAQQIALNAPHRSWWRFW